MGKAIAAMFFVGVALILAACASAQAVQYTAVDLGTLPGDSYSQAYGINSSGQVVGYSSDSTGHQHAFLWSISGGMVDLGTLPGDSTELR